MYKYKLNNQKTMRQKMTIEQFDEILVGLNEGNQPKIMVAISMIAEGTLDSDYLSEIPRYMKASLGRKVLRYIAKVALSGTFEIDGLAASVPFCEMRDGNPVSFASNVEWSFDHTGQLVNVTINSKGDEVYYYDRYSKEIWHCEIPYGCHWMEPSGKADIVRMFEDFDLNRRR